MREVWRKTLLLAVCGALPAGAFAQGVEGDGARDEFRYAWDRIATLESLKSPAADSPKLRRYPLYPYLQAARLRQSLSRVAADAREVRLESATREFLKTQQEMPVVSELQRDWLNYLGQRAAWNEFQTDAPEKLSDPALRCHSLSARLATQNLDGLREAVLAQWLESRAIPKACEPVFAWLDTPVRLSPAETEQRARIATLQKLPLPLTLESLTPERRAALKYWSGLQEDAEAGLQQFLAGEAPPLPAAELADLLLQAFERVARAKSLRARPLFEGLLKRAPFDAAQRSRLQRSYALGLAYDHDAEAVKQFSPLPDSALDTLSHEWRVRSALLHNDWKRATHWLEAMPEAQRQEPRWRYWRARAHERRGDTQQAQALYAEVAQEREYHGFLAAERLGRKPDLRHQPLPDDWTTLDLLAATPALRRARELFLCDLPELAAAEFRLALRDLPASAKLQAARLAANWGWHERAVQQLAELQLWNDLWLRFPTPYDGEISAAARDTGVPSDWLYTVLRTESLYNPRAVSRAGALGLLQMLLPTARQVAQRAGLSRPERDDLFKPEINVALGARYLSEMQQKFGGRFILTLAAYNAGPQRVPGWLPKSEIPGDVWVENIPFNETRNYVQRALSSLVMIGWRRNGEPAPILPLLSPVLPAGEDAS